MEDTFTPLEQAFKYLYQHSIPAATALTMLEDPACGLVGILEDDPAAFHAFQSILQTSQTSGVLDEHLFFTGDEDVRLNLHARYMPPFHHSHHFFELQYVLAGTMHQTVGRQELELGAGDICFIAPDTEHAISVFDDETIIVNILINIKTFQETFAGTLNTEDIISDFFTRVLYRNSFYPYMYCHTHIHDALSSVISYMLQIQGSDMRLKNKMLVNKLEELFILLLNDHEFDFVTGTSVGEANKKILPILRFVQENYKTVSLTETADHFGYSESYLSRIISLYSGQNFSQILRSVRLKKAADLLTNTDMPISDISALSGYEDRTYFHKVFRRQFQMPPAQYRKQFRR